MYAIDAATVKRSKAQFRSRRFGTAAPPTPLASSSFAPSTSVGRVTLDVIMVQLQRMDVRLDTLSTKLYQVNTRVGRIAKRQARLGGYVDPPEASEDDEDGDASSSSSDEMST